MAFMICARNFTLRTTLGYVIVFEAGKATWVPPMAEQLALASNCVYADESNRPTGEGTAEKNVSFTVDGLLRKTILLHTIDELIKENDTDNFSGGGAPKPGALSDRSGLKVSAQERTALYDEYRDILGRGEELPTHKHLATIREVQQLTTLPQMRNYAPNLGLSEERIAGMTAADAKQVLLAVAVNPDLAKQPVA